MNLWKIYKGRIVYLVMDEPDIKRLSKEEEGILGVQFGDSLSFMDVVINTNGIEHMSIVLKYLLYLPNSPDYFLVCDAYIMQAKDRTITGKGAAIKGFLSTFTARVKKLNKTIIFVSENIDQTLTRNFKKFSKGA